MDDRRESRIPRPGWSGAGGAKPLENSRASNMPAGMSDRKRKADTIMETSQDAKRQTMAISQQGTSRPTRSNTTTGTGRSLQQATSARPVGFELGPIQEETWDDIRARTGQDINDVLNKKLSFAKGTKPERKVEAFVPYVRELKALGKDLKSKADRHEMDATQWKTAYDALSAKSEEVDHKLASVSLLVAEQEKKIDKLESQLAAAKEQAAEREAALTTLRAQYEVAAQQVKDKEAEVSVNRNYTASLQNYNTGLQADLTSEKARTAELQRSSIELQRQMAELGGKLQSMEQLLSYEREQVVKLREERETATRDLAMLRADLDNTRQERERAVADAAKAKDDLDRLRAAGGKSLETLEALNNDKATMETQLTMQQKLMVQMREELAQEKSSRAEAAAVADSRGTQINEFKAQVERLQNELADAERRVYEGELHRRKLHNIIQDLKGNIRVFCRVRPASPAEETSSSHDSAMALDFPTSGDLLGRGLVISVPGSGMGQTSQKHSFSFDRVFTPGTTQIEVFDEISELVQSALDGHKVCVFAYGQTGSGKTFTMVGNRENPGVIPCAMQQIFEAGQKLSAQDWTFIMQASMLEIYNEEIRDLLSRKKDDGKKLQVSHDANGVTTVSDLTVVDVDSPEKVDILLAQAREKRSVGCTALNEQSSRSHMVFIMRIEGHNTVTDVKVSGVLNLIDLAGSERVKDSGATGQRLKEAQAINKSLSALGDVIMAIANKQDHVPFRNSKLTYLLQPCLGGDAKTLMFLNVAPTREFATESLCSLRFGAKVNACEINAPKKNVVVPRG